MKVDAKLVHRLFYPQVPALLAARHRGRVSAMPVVSYASVSDSPPMVAVGCNPESFTCKLAVEAGSFSLSVLGRDGVRALEKLATTHGSEVKDKLAAAGLAHRKGRALGAPVVAGAVATLECKVRSKARLGDHVLLVGEVKAASASEAFSDFWDFRRYRPILYAGWRGGLKTYDG
jgi:flavin reductase (DIM6/NTAB) family NADH-FMN oxidoreductase RutF